MPMPFDIELRQPWHTGAGSSLERNERVTTLTNVITDWRHERITEGDLRATFKISEGAGGLTAGDMWRFFQQHWGFNIRATKGETVIFDGAVWEMSLSLAGTKRAFDMDNLYNKVAVVYQERSDGKRIEKISDWYEDENSQDRFSVHEQVINSGREMPREEANRLAADYLSRHAWPRLEMVDLNIKMANELRVTLVGRLTAANKRYVHTNDYENNSEVTASERFTDIVENDLSPILWPGRIEDSGARIKRRTSIGLDSNGNESYSDRYTNNTRVITYLSQIASMANPAYNGTAAPWTIEVVGTRIDLKPVDTTPRYFWYRRRGQNKSGWVTASGAPVGVTAVPGVMRDKVGGSGPPPPGTWMEDAADTYISSITVRGDGSVEPGFDQPDPYAMEAEALRLEDFNQRVDEYYEDKEGGD